MWRCTVFLCPIFFFLLLCCKFFWIFCFCFVFIFFCSCPLVVFIFIFLPPSLFIIFYGQLVNFYDRCIEYHFRRSTTPTMMYRHKVVFFFFFYFFLYMSKKKKTRLNFLGLTKTWSYVWSVERDRVESLQGLHDFRTRFQVKTIWRSACNLHSKEIKICVETTDWESMNLTGKHSERRLTANCLLFDMFEMTQRDIVGHTYAWRDLRRLASAQKIEIT